MTNVPDFDLEDFTEDEYEIKLLLHRPKFIDGVLELRKKWNIPVEGFENNKSLNAWVEELGERKQVLKNEIRTFAASLGLSERWDDAIYQYLESDSPGMLRVQSVNPIKLEYDDMPLDRKNVRSVWIQVDRDTTEKEALEVFSYAKGLFGDAIPKKQRAKYLNADLEIWRMHLKGVSNKEILNKVANDETEERALTQDDISLIIRRMRKRLN